jgi:hypothetical protein
MPKFVRAFGGAAFAQGSAFCSNEYTGVALWLRPNVHPHKEGLVELMQSTASPGAREAGGKIFEQMAKYRPEEAHWYLSVIGVDPAHQRKGQGDAADAACAGGCRSRKSASVPRILQPAEPLSIPSSRL